MNKFKQLWRNLRSGFWFVPSLIVAVSIALMVGLIDARLARTSYPNYFTVICVNYKY